MTKKNVYIQMCVLLTLFLAIITFIIPLQVQAKPIIHSSTSDEQHNIYDTKPHISSSIDVVSRIRNHSKTNNTSVHNCGFASKQINVDGGFQISGAFGPNIFVDVQNLNGLPVLIKIDQDDGPLATHAAMLIPAGGTHTFNVGHPYGLIHQLPQFVGFTLTTALPTYANLIAVSIRSEICYDQELVQYTGQLSSAPRPLPNQTGQIVFYVTLGRRAVDTTYVKYSTSDGTARAGIDYRATSGTLSFAPGQISKQVSIPIYANSAANPTDTLNLNLGAGGTSRTGLQTPLFRSKNGQFLTSTALLGTIIRSGEVAPPPQPQAPITPIGLHVKNRTTSSVTLGWSAVTGTIGYRIFRDSVQIAQLPSTSTSVTIGSLKDNTSYSFTVAAFNGAGQSAQSAPVTVQTLPTWKFEPVSTNVYDEAGKPADLAHMRPGQRGRIEIKVKNIGSATWRNTGTGPVRLATDRPHGRDSILATTGWLSPKRPANVSQSAVAPGGIGTFTFPYVTPMAAGSYKEYFTLVAEGLTWFNDTELAVQLNVVPVVGIASAPGTPNGYWLAAADGGVFAYDGAPFFGSMGDKVLNKPVVGIAAMPSGKGYWLAGADGGVFNFGNAVLYGGMAGKPLNKPVVGIAATPTGKGYWLVAADGGVFNYGDAELYGSMANDHLNKPVVGIASTPSGKGYWLAAADGGVFAYGDARFLGSMGESPLNQAVVGIRSTPTGQGYWLVAADGGIFAYGDAWFRGSIVGQPMKAPIVGMMIMSSYRGYKFVGADGKTYTPTVVPVVGMALTPSNKGYWLATGADGRVLPYGDAVYYGSMGGQPLNKPVVGIAATPTGKGYWLVAADGGVFNFGDAVLYGGMAGKHLNKPVVGIASTPTGKGYWLVAADGGVFNYGDAVLYGGMAGKHLNQPVVGIAGTPSGKGYWMTAGDGGVFNYGDAGLYGTMVDQHLNKPVVGITSTPLGRGYWLVAADGGVFNFGDAPFIGAPVNLPVSAPIVGMVVSPKESSYSLVASNSTLYTYVGSLDPPPPPPPPPPSRLYAGERLDPGKRLVSPNGKYALIMQTDGNLVLYTTVDGVAIWEIFKGGNPGAVLVNQPDGNMVVYGLGGIALWSSGTPGNSGAFLFVQDDGNLVVYSADGRALWNSGTAR